LNGRIFVFGGEAPTGTFADNEAFEPTTNSWSAFAPMPTARHGMGAIAFNSLIYVLAGGQTSGGSGSTLNEVFKP
jgi:hypothetical protein